MFIIFPTISTYRHVEGDVFPNLEGTKQLGFFKLSGDQLTLSTHPISAWGKEWIFSLIWKFMN